ncbi:5'-deoxynucleotidase [Paenibacillus turpanensis]|uniref:5'-deoxynucleotidase n=1 Tax=Paenibacillus turpanensis TaxID=2689078 RepID=UPI00140CE99C|nr:5'-deoxynucleotidase [Paenibacillus turpanensis]
MSSHFYAYMFRLRYIERWSLMRNTMKENVAEHSYHVALLTHALCTIGNELFGKSIPTERVVTMSLFHDATEVFTGDIPTPVKHQNDEILKNFRHIEGLAAERLLRMVPSELQQVYEPLIAGSPEPDPYKMYVKAADLLDAYLKCSMELSAGNREFARAKKQIEESVQALQMEELNWFIEHLAPSFEKTLDELSE